MVTKPWLVLAIAAAGLACAGVYGLALSHGPARASHPARPAGEPSGFASARATLAGMSCAGIGLRGGAAVGNYHVYVCAGPDHASLSVPKGAYVCWGFHDFGLGREQPAVALNLLDARGRTIGGHVYPQTTLSCQRTLKAVQGVL